MDLTVRSVLAWATLACSEYYWDGQMNLNIKIKTMINVNQSISELDATLYVYGMRSYEVIKIKILLLSGALEGPGL